MGSSQHTCVLTKPINLNALKLKVILRNQPGRIDSTQKTGLTLLFNQGTINPAETSLKTGFLVSKP